MVRTNLTQIIALSALALLCASLASWQSPKDECHKWRTQVDPRFARVEINEKELSDAEALLGIECLIELKGDRNTARFTGYTNVSTSVSSRPPVIKKPATIEVAALYYASFVFYKDWGHAGSVRLFDPDTWKSNSSGNVKSAYKSYESWLINAKKIGLQKARELKVDPLEGSGIQWS